jgi:ABC-type transporter Mla maintaining outer membrane lipid asymmetry permease subunit MlaE
VADVRTWGEVLLVQMARVGVASLPIALFIAAFTGIVLALQASYTFTGAVPSTSWACWWARPCCWSWGRS